MSAEHRAIGLPDPLLYPEIAAAGGLAVALSQTASSTGLDLHDVAGPEGPEHLRAAVIGTDRGYISVNTALLERWFLLDTWWRGVRLMWGKAADMNAVAGVAHAWQSGAPLREIQDRWPFISLDEKSEAHERGDADEVVRIQWHRLQTCSGHPELDAVINAAFRQPRLRVLYPYTSHNRLCFSSRVGYPYSVGLPLIERLGVGQFRVIGKSLPAQTRSPTEAAAAAAAGLPDNCGPAKIGTAEDDDQTDHT
ncbi:MAG: DUF6193 family natural product biosynthesis protein [Streptosporangiaceae bacterium]